MSRMLSWAIGGVIISVLGLIILWIAAGYGLNAAESYISNGQPLMAMITIGYHMLPGIGIIIFGGVLAAIFFIIYFLRRRSPKVY